MRKTFVISIDKTSLEIRDSNESGEVLLNVCCKDMKFDPSNDTHLEAFKSLLFDFVFNLFISKKAEE